MNYALDTPSIMYFAAIVACLIGHLMFAYKIWQGRKFDVSSKGVRWNPLNICFWATLLTEDDPQAWRYWFTPFVVLILLLWPPGLSLSSGNKRNSTHPTDCYTESAWWPGLNNHGPCRHRSVVHRTDSSRFDNPLYWVEVLPSNCFLGTHRRSRCRHPYRASFRIVRVPKEISQEISQALDFWVRLTLIGRK